MIARRSRAAGAVLGALVAVGFGSGLVAAGPTYAADAPPTCSDGTDDSSTPGKLTSNPTADQLDIADFQKAVIAAGASSVGGGVDVAVVDSGVDTKSNLPIVPGTIRVTGAAVPVQDTDGTTVAGIIAGKAVPDGPVVGIAPSAGILDVHVWDTTSPPSPDTSSDQGVTLTTGTVVTGLDDLLHTSLLGRSVKVVVVPVQVAGSPELKAAVRAITARGVVVVAPSGDRTATGDSGSGVYPSGFGTPKKGEDVASLVYPAGYSLDPAMKGLVVAVGSTVPAGVSPSTFVLYNSATDVAAPSVKAGSYTVSGIPCRVGAPSTHIAAAQVAGVLAGLLSIPGMTPEVAVARLEATASGLSEQDGVPTDRLVGQGVIQPVEAVTRPLTFRGGKLVESGTPQVRATPVPLPAKEPDVLRSTRHHALWWGLGGGATLLVAVMLRPVLARRRT